MKVGCIVCLVIFAGSWFGYFVFLGTTPLAGKSWLPPLLAFSLMIVVFNLWGVLLALKQKVASRKSPNEWRDGELVGICGAVSSSRPLTAPFSGKPASIVEYEISKTTSSGDSTQKRKECFGFMMTPTSVQGMRGSARIIGFPMFAHIKGESVTGEAAYQNAGAFLMQHDFKPEPGNPLKILSEINAVLSDDDGVVDAHFGDVTLKECVLAGDYDPEELDRVTDTDDGIDDIPPDEDFPEQPIDTEAAAKRLGERLYTSGYDLTETIVAPGQTVTVFGTYRASKQAIDIGSGIANLTHTIQRGEMSSVIGKNLRKSFIALIVWGAIAAAGHWYVGKMVGLFQ